MKLKNNIKINNVILISLISFAAIVLLLLYLIQILSLNKFYEIYKINQTKNIVKKIKEEKNVDTELLENIAYENGVCIFVYENGNDNAISTIYNKGCIFSDKEKSKKYVSKFIEEKKEEDTYYVDNSRFKNKTIIRALKLKDGRYIFINTSIVPLDSSINLIRRQYIYIAIALLLLSLILAYIMSKQLSRPIENISSSAKQLALGKFDTKFESDINIKELNELAQTLEGARNELSKTDELRKDLMANVGHDLRTPLTMIKAYAEMSRDLDSQTDKKRKENMSIIIEETDRLNILVSDILDLSKLQSNTYELIIEEFDLNELIKSIIKRYYILIDNNGYRFIYNNKNDKKVLIKADKKRIEQVIYNLINNAVNYTGKDKKIYINLKENKEKIRVEITDTGKGIDKSEINHIWDKYYHNEKKHRRNIYGTGLGLSIVKTILESHNYNYGVNSKKGVGTTFYFEIDK